MAKSPRDTHGPIVASGPTRGQNRSRNKDGSWRAKRSDAGSSKDGGAKDKPNLARWFWGSIVIMATLSISLSLMAIYQQDKDNSAAAPNEPSATEMSSSVLKTALEDANIIAADKVKLQISAMLDNAYQPAYDAISMYAEIHYSVWGEYAELGAAAIGDVGVKLEETLFGDLGPRLESVGAELDQVFNNAFKTSLEQEKVIFIGSGTSLGPLTEIAFDDAQRRMLITVPVGTAAITGTKAIAAVIAKKIGAKLAAKAALKAGGKLALVSATAGGGAALCAWSGPGAVLCAAGGGIGAWLVADYGIVKIDEYWNREDFELELRKMIDERKFEHQVALETAVASRALAVQEMTDAVVQDHAFTLKELSGEGNAATCRITKELIDGYSAVRGSIAERTPEALSKLRAKAAGQAENLSIGSLAQEITDNLSDAEQMTVTYLRIKGNLPPDQRADRDVSGRLILNKKSIEIPQTGSDKSGGFFIVLAPEMALTLGQPLNYAIVLEQHLRIRSDQYFGGHGEEQIIAATDATGGLEHWINLSLKISYDEQAKSLDEVKTTWVMGEPLSLILGLRAASLPALQKFPDCE